VTFCFFAFYTGEEFLSVSIAKLRALVACEAKRLGKMGTFEK